MILMVEVITSLRGVVGEQARRIAGASNVYECQSGDLILLVKTNI